LLEARPARFLERGTPPEFPVSPGGLRLNANFFCPVSPGGLRLLRVNTVPCASVTARCGTVREATTEKRAVFSKEGFVDTAAGVKVNPDPRLVTKFQFRKPSLGNPGGVWRV
jgi:hypothetical protein